MRQYIGIDLGGTNLRGALWECTGELSHKVERKSLSKRPPKELLGDIVAMIGALRDRANLEIGGVGVGVPGIVDATKGIVFQSPHLPGFKAFPFREEIEKEIREPLFIENDANCAALGELVAGSGRGKKHLLCLTLGTGIGGGVIIDGNLYHGERGFAAELGHVVVRPEGPPCSCGGRGCFELYASAQGVERILREIGDTRADKRLNAEDIARAAGRGESWAREFFGRFGYYLGIGIASIVNVLGIHTVVIGGGLSGAWDYFIESLEQEFARRSYKETAGITEIKRAQLGDNAGVIGAAYGASRLGQGN